MQKNVAGQKWIVFAFDATDGSPKTGDALNITANLRRDGVQDAVADTNPTETERGQYEFDLEQGETNGNLISIAPNSTTADIEVVGMPMAVWTTAPNFNKIGIEDDGDITKINALHGHTVQTGDSYAKVNDGSFGLAKLVRSATPANTLTIANGAVDAKLTYIMDTILAETSGQLAGRFINFFDQDSAGFNIKTALSAFKATSVTVSDKAGFKLASDGLDGISAGSGDIKSILDDTNNLQGNQGAWATATGFSTSAKLLAYVQLLARKDSAIASDRSTELAEINNNEGAGGGAYSNQVEAQEALRDAMVDSNPQNHSATANNELGNTTLDGGTYVNTATDDGSYYQTGPGVAVGGFGLNCDLTFNISTGRVPIGVIVDAKFTSGGLRTVQTWAYDYIASAYVQLSNSATDFGHSASDSTEQYAMTQNMVQISDGEIKIRFTSTSETITDVFNADLVTVSSVAQEAAGLTGDALQQAVWARADTGHDHNTLGHALGSMFIVDALVVTVTSTSQFKIDTGIGNNDAFNGVGVSVRDETDGHHEIRKIVNYIGSTKEIFLDRALSFTPVAGDVVHILGVIYGDKMDLIDTPNSTAITAFRTEMEKDGATIYLLAEALINKLAITEANGNTELFNAAGASQGTIAAAFSTDGATTTRKRMVV